MEDARFVRFTDGDEVIYYATYTAFDGSQVAPHLLETRDFQTFNVCPAVRAVGQQQGHGDVSPPHRRPLCRALSLG